ncbi:MAG TPA: oligosaccharide flippase family protein [Stenomitos sp.]
MLKTSFFNLALRGLTLASKFLLMLFLARFLQPEEIGVYGLMTATVASALFFLGMDFYVFSTRELLAKDRPNQARLVLDQVAFHGVVYVIVLPLLLVVFLTGVLPWIYVGWMYLLLILEHTSQEAYRLLTTLSRPVAANVTLFLRSGAWAYAVVAAVVLLPATRDLRTVWFGWGIGVLLSLVYAGYVLRGLGWRAALKLPINWRWIRTGLLTALPFFASTLALKTIEYSDRYFIEHFCGKADVGIYTFYSSIANAVQAFVFAGVISVLYPKLVEAFQQGHMAEYRAHYRQMKLTTLGGVLISSSLAAVAILPLLALVKRPVFAEHLPVYWLLLVSASAVSLGYIPHYGLYAQKRDRAIVTITFISVAVSLLGNALLVPRWGMMGAATASTLAMSAMALMKTGALFERRPATQPAVLEGP